MSEKEGNGNELERGWDARFSVLVISDCSEERTELRQMVGDAGLDVMTCPIANAERVLADKVPDVTVICSEHDSKEILTRTRRLRPDTPVLIAGTNMDVEGLVSMIRGGACDYVQLPCPAENLVCRLRAAVKSSQEGAGGERLRRLQSICKKLNQSRRDISQRLDQMEKALEVSRSEAAEQLDVATSTAAFEALVSQELGVEDVLRTSLEYILGTTGPTNAAVFLANSETEYTLGAYVSYECPRELADPVLERLGTQVCKHVANEGDLVRFQDVDGFIETIGASAEILKNSDVVAVPCIFEDECLAIIFLFRDKEAPFGEELAPMLDSLRSVLGEQLATVVRIHNRTGPEWPDAPSHERDEPSDWGFGEDDMAA